MCSETAVVDLYLENIRGSGVQRTKNSVKRYELPLYWKKVIRYVLFSIIDFTKQIKV